MEVIVCLLIKYVKNSHKSLHSFFYDVGGKRDVSPDGNRFLTMRN